MTSLTVTQLVTWLCVCVIFSFTLFHSHFVVFMFCSVYTAGLHCSALYSKSVEYIVLLWSLEAESKLIFFMFLSFTKRFQAALFFCKSLTHWFCSLVHAYPVLAFSAVLSVIHFDLACWFVSASAFFLLIINSHSFLMYFIQVNLSLFPHPCIELSRLCHAHIFR